MHSQGNHTEKSRNRASVTTASQDAGWARAGPLAVPAPPAKRVQQCVPGSSCLEGGRCRQTGEHKGGSRQGSLPLWGTEGSHLSLAASHPLSRKKPPGVCNPSTQSPQITSPLNLDWGKAQHREELPKPVSTPVSSQVIPITDWCGQGLCWVSRTSATPLPARSSHQRPASPPPLLTSALGRSLLGQNIFLFKQRPSGCFWAELVFVKRPLEKTVKVCQRGVHII